MAGGRFDKSVGKVRPGNYVNFVDNDTALVNGSERGVVLIPLVNTDYGPAQTFINISAQSLDSAKPYLGYSVTETDPANNMLLIREAFKGANRVVAYICSDGTTKAQGTGGGVKGVAKYKGARGNALSFAIIANPAGGFDVEISLDGGRVETFERVSSVADLASSKWIDFTATQTTPGTDDPISAVAGVALTGGTSGTTTNGDITDFLDASEGVGWNAMVFPMSDSTLQAAAKTKVKYLREQVGKGVQIVCPEFAADYEGVINVTNSYALPSGSEEPDYELTTAEACAYVAGITAGASNVQSNTWRIVDSAKRVVGLKTQEAAVTAINNSEFFFSANGADVIVEYDINSLKTFTVKKGKNYRKNRVLRVYDTFQEAIQANFPPNKFDNGPDDWSVMKGIGNSILKLFGPKIDGGIGAIKNIDYAKDFLIDEELSVGDQTFFNVGLQAVDSSEKLYFTVNTR